MQQPIALVRRKEDMMSEIINDDERLDYVNEKITLIQKKDGLTFGTDAFLLAAFMKEQKRACAVELGAGTGIISLLCAARDRFEHIYAIEIQEDFYDITRRNVNLNSFAHKIDVTNSDVRSVSSTTFGKEMDVVFSNPPYMRTDSGKPNLSSRKQIARHEVCGGIDDFCASAERLLKHGGKFYCVWRPDRLSELMTAMSAHRLEPKTMVFVHADENSEPSVALISATKGGAPAMRILPPLLLHSADSRGESARQLSERAQRIYETMSFYD